MVKQYGQLYLDTRHALLETEDAQTAGMMARQLLCHFSGKSPEAILADRDLYASEQVCRDMSRAVRRLLDGEPLAYVLGEWEFYGLPLDISESVLIPRPDTETLAEAAIGWLRQQDAPRVLDLCAGSGCLGLAIASQVKDARVVLGELSDGALRICRQNIRRNGLTGRVTAMQLDALHPPLQRLGDFDCIVSNPPYIPSGDIPGLDASVRDYEPHMALDGGADGLDFYRAILRHWPAVLHPGSRLYFEVGIGQADDVLRLMRSVGFGDLEILPDPAGIPRVVLGALYQEI